MSNQNHNAHEKVEKNIGLMAVLITVALSLGGLAEIVPGELDGPVLIVVGEVAAQAVQTALPALTELAS